MRKFLFLSVTLLLLAACKDGHMTGDDPTRNDEGPWEGRPMDSNPSMRERSSEVPESKRRAYADDDATEQETAAPPDPQ
jgi:hypothetical protein